VMNNADSNRMFIPSAVRIGGMSKSDLLRALREQNVRLNNAAEALFEDRRFTTLGNQHLIEIAALTVSELGFGEGATYGQLIARALASGWSECPLELGPHLRLQFLDQPDGADGRPLTHGQALLVPSPSRRLRSTRQMKHQRDFICGTMMVPCGCGATGRGRPHLEAR